MRGARGGRSALFTAPVGNHFAQLTALRGDFTNPVINGKIPPEENKSLAIDQVALKTGRLVL